MAAYTHITALSWAKEFFFMAAACTTRLPHILVLVEPSLLVHNCLFVSENPAHFAVNLYILEAVPLSTTSGHGLLQLQLCTTVFHVFLAPLLQPNLLKIH